MCRLASFFVVLLCIVLCTVSVCAKDDRAKQIFNEAADLFTAGDYIGASQRFSAANAESPNWKLFFNIGQCEAAAKRYGRAMNAFEAYLAYGGDDVSTARRDEVEEELDSLKRLVGFLEVEGPLGGQVFLDGENRGAIPLPGALAVAAVVTHQLKIVKDGEVVWVQALRINGGQRRKIGVSSVEPSPDENSSEEKNESPAFHSDKVLPESESVRVNENKDVIEEKTPHSEFRGVSLNGPQRRNSLSHRYIPWALVALGIGGSSLVAGGIAGTMALGLNKDLEKRCNMDDGCPPAYHDKNNRMKRLALASSILLPTGGVLAVVGTVMLLVGEKKRSDEKLVQVSPLVSSAFSGVLFRGRF